MGPRAKISIQKKADPSGIDPDVFGITQELYVSDICDQDCEFCSVDINQLYDRKDKQEKSLVEFKKDLDIMIHAGNILRFTGGEPTMRADLPLLIEYARKIGFQKITVESNGQNLSDRKYARQLVNAGANDFLISVHGHNAKMHDRLTGTAGSFAKTVKAIENLLALKTQISANIVVNKKNYIYIDKILGFLEEIGLSRKSLSFITINGLVQSFGEKTVPKLSDVAEYLRTIPDHYTFNIQHIPFCFLGKLNRRNTWIYDLERRTMQTPNYNIIFEPINENFVKAPQCAACRFEPICYGVEKGYARIYGYEELKPVAGDKLFNRSAFLRFLNN